jgi:hypothetical protein
VKTRTSQRGSYINDGSKRGINEPHSLHEKSRFRKSRQGDPISRRSGCIHLENVMGTRERAPEELREASWWRRGRRANRDSKASCMQGGAVNDPKQVQLETRRLNSLRLTLEPEEQWRNPRENEESEDRLRSLCTPIGLSHHSLPRYSSCAQTVRPSQQSEPWCRGKSPQC